MLPIIEIDRNDTRTGDVQDVCLGTAIIISSSGAIYWAKKYVDMGFFLDRRGAFP
jgi:hypothetical protein